MMERSKIYSPNSIYHGNPIFLNSKADRLVVMHIELERLRDFVEFLFDHSEHCDHITYSDAWDEFEKFEEQIYLQTKSNYKDNGIYEDNETDD